MKLLTLPFRLMGVTALLSGTLVAAAVIPTVGFLPVGEAVEMEDGHLTLLTKYEGSVRAVSHTHLRTHATNANFVCRLLLDKTNAIQQLIGKYS